MDRADPSLRRLAALSNHLFPEEPASDDVNPSLLHTSPTFSLSRGSGAESTSYASATGAPSKYAKVHGPVSSEPAVWRSAPVDNGPPLVDVIYEKASGEGIVKITINRPEKRNAFRPETIKELQRAFSAARDDTEVGVIIFTGKGDLAFCSGGDQSVRGNRGYVGEKDTVPRLNVLDLQVQIRRLPKPVIAMVAGYAIGGGHILHMVCDLTLAADNAVFGQTGPKVGSFDAGYGSSIMSRLVGPKKAREIWYLCRHYSAMEARDMGLVNAVVPLAELERETVKWCREILRNSPTAVRILKSALNAVDDGHAGLQELAGDTTLVFYGTDEAREGRQSYLEGKRPDFSKFPYLP